MKGEFLVIGIFIGVLLSLVVWLIDIHRQGKASKTSEASGVFEDAWKISVPITLGFDVTQPIGQLTIFKSFLPPTPDFVFSIAIQAKKVDHKSIYDSDPMGCVLEYELSEVSLLSDANYIAYLRKIGKLPPETPK